MTSNMPKLKTLPKGVSTTRSERTGPKLIQIPELTNLALPKDIASILDQQGLKLRVEFISGATTVEVYDDSNRKVGTYADLLKIVGIKKYVLHEQKEVIESSWRIHVKAVYLRFLLNKGEKPQAQIVPEHLFAQLRPIEIDYETVVANMELVTKTPAIEHSDSFKKLLIESGNAIIGVLEELATQIIECQPKKLSRDELLSKSHVPRWIYLKLINKINFETTCDYCKFFFPINTIKGLQLSVQEIREGLMEVFPTSVRLANRLIVQVANKDSLFAELCGLSTDSLTYQKDMSVILATRMYVTPPECVIEKASTVFLERSTKIALPPMGAPYGLNSLSSISIALLHIAYVMPVADAKNYYKEFFKYEVQSISTTGKNWKIQLFESLKTLGGASIPNLDTFVYSKKTIEYITSAIRVDAKGPVGVTLFSLINQAKPESSETKEDSKDKKPTQPVLLTTVKPGKIIGLLNKPTDAEQAVLKSVLKAPPRKVRVQNLGVFTPLGQKARDLTASLEQTGRNQLAELMKGYFRSFTSTALQDGAATLALARLDTLFEPDRVEEETEPKDSEYED